MAQGTIEHFFGTQSNVIYMELIRLSTLVISIFTDGKVTYFFTFAFILKIGVRLRFTPSITSMNIRNVLKNAGEVEYNR